MPKREKVSGLREKARLQVISGGPNYRLARFGIRDGHCFRADLTRFVRTRAFVTGVGSSPLRQLKEAMTLLTVNVWRQRIQRASTADIEEESATPRTRNPTFLKILCTVKLSRNISAETLLSFSSRAIWTVRRSNSIPRPCF